MTRVLQVEDQPPMRILVKVNLDREGIDVVQAVDGPSGVRAALEERPDAVILGIHLKGLNGIEVAQHLRDHPDTRAIPIVFLAARREFCDCVRELGFNDVAAVHAPFNPLVLGGFLENLLESAQPHQPTTFAELQPLWALRRIATTPDDVAIPDLVAQWREQWLS